MIGGLLVFVLVFGMSADGDTAQAELGGQQRPDTISVAIPASPENS